MSVVSFVKNLISTILVLTYLWQSAVISPRLLGLTMRSQPRQLEFQGHQHQGNGSDVFCCWRPSPMLESRCEDMISTPSNPLTKPVYPELLKSGFDHYEMASLNYGLARNYPMVVYQPPGFNWQMNMEWIVEQLKGMVWTYLNNTEFDPVKLNITLADAWGSLLGSEIHRSVLLDLFKDGLAWVVETLIYLAEVYDLAEYLVEYFLCVFVYWLGQQWTARIARRIDEARGGAG